MMTITGTRIPVLLAALAVTAAVGGQAVHAQQGDYDWSNYDWSLEEIELGTPDMTTDEAIEEAVRAAASSSMAVAASAVGFDIPAGSTAEQYLEVLSEVGGGSYHRAETGGGLSQVMADAASGRPSTPHTPTPTASIGDLVICREVVNGTPVGVGTAFERLPEITLFHSYRGQAPGQAEVVWFRDGNELTRSTTQIQGGDGYAWFTVRGGGGNLLPDGRYEAALSMPGRPVARVSFTLGEPGMAAAPTPAPTPPAPTPQPVPTTPGMPGDIGGLQVGIRTEGATVIGAADHFNQINTVAAAMTYQNVPQGSVAVAVWTRDGTELTRSQREIGGSGWVSFSMSMQQGHFLPPGRYTLTITVGTTVLGRKSFTIGGGVG